MEATTVADKEVLALFDADLVTYAYAAGDAVFMVGGSDDLIEAALAELP